MGKTVRLLSVAVILMLAAVPDALAQKHPERHLIRGGNRSYNDADYAQSEESYRRALEANPESVEAMFNLADALYKQEKYDEAVRIMTDVAKSASLNNEERARVFHNLGNAMFAQNKLKEALEYYKESLRQDPRDYETKYNLAYVQELLKQQEQNDQNSDGGGNDGDSGDDKQENSGDDQNDNKNDGNGDQNSEDEGQNSEDGDADRNNDPSSDPGEDKREGDSQFRPGEISREDAENILNAIQQQENQTQEKVNEQRQAPVARSGKNW